MRELEYPFDSDFLLKKKRKIKRQLLEEMPQNCIKKKIAILGGSTTSEIRDMLELFLLNAGIESDIYESEYNRYYEDGAFPNEELKAFAPDIVYIHTTNRNIYEWPEVGEPVELTEQKAKNVVSRLKTVWDNVEKEYNCSIIQNNFEYLYYRLLGNQDGVFSFGYTHFINCINGMIAEEAQRRDNFYVHDICYEAASFGIDNWFDLKYWNMYKYGMSRMAIPVTAYNVFLIIKSLLGKNKKAFSLDLDNTLWGGVIGDDGADNIDIGKENAIAEGYTEFQNYIKRHKDIGIVLSVNSKNNEDTAREGFRRTDTVLTESDFVSFKANWEPKCNNLVATANDLNLLPESFVFVDDNPAEREIVRQNVNGVAIPEIDEIEKYIRTIDKAGYFEVTSISKDDLERNKMYSANAARKEQEAAFSNYKDYLLSLEMQADIKPFEPMYMARIAQLTNKSNQYNLTTRRYTQAEIEKLAQDDEYLTLYGRLIDKFGDNGVVSVVIGRKEGKILHLELWLMSCRVLKRDMEYAMMDSVIHWCQQNAIEEVRGYYYVTPKNAMVKDFYDLQGFEQESAEDNGDSVWKYCITDAYVNKNNVINIRGEE